MPLPARTAPGIPFTPVLLAMVLAVAGAACGVPDDTAAPTTATSTTATSTTATSATAADEGVTIPPEPVTTGSAPVSIDASMVGAVDAYIAAVADGDLAAAWELVDERSRSALGGYPAFEALRSALSEGIGAWSTAVGRTSHVIRLDEDAAVVLLRGTVPLEGSPAPAAHAVLVRRRGDEARVSPFEQALPEGRSIGFTPPPPTEVPPAGTVEVAVPEGLAVTVAVGTAGPATPAPVQQEAGSDLYRVELPAAPADDGHVVTIAVADAGGDRATASGLWPVDEPSAPPATAEEVAGGFVGAWVDGDQRRMEELAEPAAVQQALALADRADRGWRFGRCEGAVGSAYCTWADGSEQLVVRVANVDELRLVTEFRVEP